MCNVLCRSFFIYKICFVPNAISDITFGLSFCPGIFAFNRCATRFRITFIRPIHILINKQSLDFIHHIFLFHANSNDKISRLPWAWSQVPMTMNITYIYMIFVFAIKQIRVCGYFYQLPTQLEWITRIQLQNVFFAHSKTSQITSLHIKMWICEKPNTNRSASKVWSYYQCNDAVWIRCAVNTIQ